MSSTDGLNVRESLSYPKNGCWTVSYPAERKTEGGPTTSSELVMHVSDSFTLRWLEAQAHRRAWVSLGWVRRYC